MDMHVRAMGHKQYRSEPLSDKEKARLRALNGVKSRWAADQNVKSLEVKKVRDFVAPMKENFKPAKRGSGCRLSPEKRAMVELRRGKRSAFFASLGVKV